MAQIFKATRKYLRSCVATEDANSFLQLWPTRRERLGTPPEAGPSAHEAHEKSSDSDSTHNRQPRGKHNLRPRQRRTGAAARGKESSRWKEGMKLRPVTSAWMRWLQKARSREKAVTSPRPVRPNQARADLPPSRNAKDWSAKKSATAATPDRRAPGTHTHTHTHTHTQTHRTRQAKQRAAAVTSLPTDPKTQHPRVNRSGAQSLPRAVRTRGS